MQGMRAGAVFQISSKEKASMMDPDGFGFDSPVNYVGNSHTQMNSPSVKQVISLLLTEKSKLTSTASLQTSSGAVLLSAAMRLSCCRGMNERKHDGLKEQMKPRLFWGTEKSVLMWRESFPF